DLSRSVSPEPKADLQIRKQGAAPTPPCTEAGVSGRLPAVFPAGNLCSNDIRKSRHFLRSLYSDTENRNRKINSFFTVNPLCP
ncbi:hypothetical protein, partial [Umezakia ovalisporum]|uniref:hypothetical protein n=1 Tax=Umezakia ovalisporum TaxID=75695 RepID=UPI0039C66A3B